jgi:SWI/SNF-related matrix-associated actin-dependent regulator 1 of chromatin subfamily A
MSDLNIGYSDGRYRVYGRTYDERDKLRRLGWKWDGDAKTWCTTDPRVVTSSPWPLYDTAQAKLDQALTTVQESVALSSAVDADVEVPVPEGCELLPFQRAGIAYALGRSATLLADEMGLGKTIQAVGVANAAQARQVLIVCPLSVKLNWEREIQKWSTTYPPLSVGHATAKEWPATDVVVAHWDVLSRHEAELRSNKWDLVVLDEVHLAKNRKAQRTQAVFGRRGLPAVEGRVKLAMTGTPIPNRVKEIWPVLHWLDAPVAEPWKGFHERYCGPRDEWHGRDRGYERVYNGASNLEELQQKLREQVMVRRLKADVLTELPPKRRQVVLWDPADVKGGAAALRAEAKRREELLAEASNDPAAYEAAVRRMDDPGEIEFGQMSEVRHNTALVKAPAVATHVSDLLDEGTSKVVVFAHHHDVIDILSEALAEYGAVVVTGDTPQSQRQEAVDAFQGDPSTRVFVGNIEAAGVGITLTAASTVVFAELAWRPSDVSQAEDRCHRIGQTDAVLAQHVLLDGSFDAKAAKTILAKQSIIDRALDQRPAGTETATAVAAKPTLDLAALPGLDAAATRRARTAAIAARMTPQDVADMHRGLQQLAAMDTDHARSLNGVGFSQTDSKLGHSLAARESLTPVQGALAARLCARYHRQLGPLGEQARALVSTPADTSAPVLPPSPSVAVPEVA